MVRFRTRKSKGGGKHSNGKKPNGKKHVQINPHAMHKPDSSHTVIGKKRQKKNSSKPINPKINPNVIAQSRSRTLRRTNTTSILKKAEEAEKQRGRKIYENREKFSSPSVAAAAEVAAATAKNVANNQQEFAAAMAAAAEESTPPLTPPLTQQNETGHGGGKRRNRNNRFTHKKRN